MFIRLPNNIIVNTDHITSIRFTPEQSGFDDETQESYSLQASLIISLTETEAKRFTDDDIGHLGIATSSCTLGYYREDAINLWNYFNLVIAEASALLQSIQSWL